MNRVFKDHSSRVIAVYFNEDQTKIISGSLDKTIRIWDLSNGDF